MRRQGHSAGCPRACPAQAGGHAGAALHPGAAAEEAFRKANQIARRQQAKSWELRAVMSLSRLLQKQGKRDEARPMLSEIYNWFTEGFDTADLMDATALLDSLV